MKTPVAAELAKVVARSRERALPDAVRQALEMLLVDIGGLCVASRNADYVQAAAQSWDSEGNATAIGHARSLDAAGAASREVATEAALLLAALRAQHDDLERSACAP